ncbi:protein RGF1 INDUCIBLE TRANSCRIPTION FACTOR 1 [Mercurialis annua]|uniref:protein RGF1 INDUCIBLE TRANSCRIPTION FACTOR 1 n=1 Tax=Mercurialis annua TaxID=3986 RepID=UPI00215FA0F2|nr:protein RGF1 INDUCIBLE TRANSCRIPTION FACTOR 1 [Mercurialis annua]
MVGCKLYIKKKGDWLSALLESKFFDSCDHHQQLRKNEKNVFCLDCNLEFCRHCVKSHFLHRQLQICKYVYHDVVRLLDIQKHLDCSRIQTYKINGEKAVHLNPRPQQKDARPSTKAKFGGSCDACGRYLQDLPNLYCSIACKVESVALKPKDEKNNKMITFSIQEFSQFSWKEDYINQETSYENEAVSISLNDEISEETSNQEWMMMSSPLKPTKQLRKRKGVPRRAPLC